MAIPTELLKSLGVPAHEDPEVGTFILALDGHWRHTCAADFPFQSDVELVFDLVSKTKTFPTSMPQNVAWIQNRLAEIWNAAAAAINVLAETHAIEFEGVFSLEPLHFQLPDAAVEESRWKLTVEPTGLDTSFEVTFEGLSVVDQRYENA